MFLHSRRRRLLLTRIVAKATESRKRRPIDCRYSGSRTVSVTEEKIALLKRQTGTPISYLVNRPPIHITETLINHQSISYI
ncbi:unnamed protein product [Arctogadus glacialis]